jgi:uncharacterized protein YjeT (DUF2065 family)
MFLFLPFAYLSRLNDGFVNGGGIPCIWNAVIGYPCPGCGMTRSLASLSNFDFVSAIHFNPIGFIIVVAGLLAMLFPSMAHKLFVRLQELNSEINGKSRFLFPAILLLIIWVLNIVRVQSQFYPGFN